MAEQVENVPDSVVKSQDFPKPDHVEVSLTDDENKEARNFGTAMLELGDTARPVGEDGRPGAGEVDVEFRGPGLRRDRPFSASAISRKSTASTKSRTSLSPHIITSEVSTKSLFCYRDGNFEYAIEDCQKIMVKPELDGEIRGAWLLTEIDHWDNEREKLIILCDLSLIVVKYDFINRRHGEWKRIFLHMVETLQIGDFVYPPKSLMPRRDHGGVRLGWSCGQEMSFSQRWNPWSTEIPYVTFAHHPLLYNEKERETTTFNVDDFCDSVMSAIRQAMVTKGTDRTLQVIQEPIMIESYASLTSMVFNQSHLGFNRDRNGINF